MVDDTLRDRLRKLLALARQGVGGEGVNAEAAVEKLLAKHGLALADLDDETRRIEWFTPGKGEHSRRLLYQTVYCLVGKRQQWKSKMCPGKVGIEVTPAEKMEIELRYALYTPALKKELDACFKAFFAVNDIYPREGAPTADAGDFDREELDRLVSMARGMKVVSIRRALKG